MFRDAGELVTPWAVYHVHCERVRPLLAIVGASVGWHGFGRTGHIVLAGGVAPGSRPEMSPSMCSFRTYRNTIMNAMPALFDRALLRMALFLGAESGGFLL